VDRDARLSQDEFCLALYLIFAKRANRPLPKVLPDTLLRSYKKLNEGRADDLKVLGDECFQTGDFDGAERYYNFAIEKSLQQLASYYRHRASVRFAQNKLEEAIKDCNTALLHDPSYTKAYLQKSICYLQKGLFKEALEEAQRAHDIDPTDISLTQQIQRINIATEHKNKAEECKKQRRWHEAFEAYEAFNAVCPGLISAQLGYAEVCLYIKNPAKAETTIK